MKYTPYPYQAFAEKFVLEHKAAGLFLDMGLGKTAITLSACEKLLRDYFETSKVLVIAPLLPARETWPDELSKWDQLEGLTYSLIIGTAQERIDALHTDADFYIVNRENVRDYTPQKTREYNAIARMSSGSSTITRRNGRSIWS